jgi:sugar phosphate isomerase/epimerase
MNIAASSCSWWHHSLEDGVRLASQAGFTAYEPLMFSREIFPLHGNLYDMTASQLVDLMKRHGMVLAAIHIGGIQTGAHCFRPMVDYARRAIAAAADTGCNLVVFGGPSRENERFLPFLDALGELDQLVRGSPVRLALENHYRNWIEGIADYEHIFDAIDSPNIGVTLDTGHFTASGVDPQAVARRFASKIFHVHIKDHRGVQSVPLGAGQTDNFGVVRALKEAGYTGYLSQEIECGQGPEADRAAADGIHYMRKLLLA